MDKHKISDADYNGDLPGPAMCIALGLGMTATLVLIAYGAWTLLGWLDAINIARLK